jgi:hypothetical protein
MPFDVGWEATDTVDAELLKHCISGQEIAAWLRRIDAGPMALVIDACYSARAVESEGFKPAPLGNRGLGQLAYDRGMQVLLATQADNVANSGRQGLLSEALVGEVRLRQRSARGGRVTLSDLLDYAVERVPAMFKERGFSREGLTVQRPVLYNFARRQPDVVLFGGSQTAATADVSGQAPRSVSLYGGVDVSQAKAPRPASRHLGVPAPRPDPR